MNENKIVVIGFGSLNGDDQAGWMVIDKLERECNIDNVTLFKSKADGVDWFPVVIDATEVIFIDAVKSGSEAGTIHKIGDQVECVRKSTSTHAINIVESIEMAKSLGYLKAPYFFYGIEASESRYLTETMKLSIHSLSKSLGEKLAQLSSLPSSIT